MSVDDDTHPTMGAYYAQPRSATAGKLFTLAGNLLHDLGVRMIADHTRSLLDLINRERQTAAELVLAAYRLGREHELDGAPVPDDVIMSVLGAAGLLGDVDDGQGADVDDGQGADVDDGQGAETFPFGTDGQGAELADVDDVVGRGGYPVGP